MRVVIDGSLIRNEADLHDYLARELDFPYYYGRNLDALWDVLSGSVLRPVNPVWQRSEASKSPMAPVVWRPHARPVAVTRRYPYVGPAEHRVQQTGSRMLIDSSDAVTRWLAAQERSDRTAPFMYVIDLHGQLWLAPRRSEHVACANGADVLAAGEVGFQSEPLGLRITYKLVGCREHAAPRRHTPH